MTDTNLRIVFMGTPEFAVESLQAICQAGYNVVGVVTMPDKPAGRGQQLRQSAVKQYAVEHNLRVLQPEKLKDEAFLSELRELQADLQVVVAFRMLPEVVWSMPRLGTFNLHAALLPQYRGAAPINWAVINGDTQTGATTFMLKQEIDTGDIMLREAIDILPDDNAGSVHDKLMALSGPLVLRTIEAIAAGTQPLLSQDKLAEGVALRPAPKIFKEDMRIDWQQSATNVHNLVRGLSPYPAAWTELPTADGGVATAKVFATSIISPSTLKHGEIATDGKTYLHIGAADGAVSIRELQLAGKKRMDIKAFLQGFKFNA